MPIAISLDYHANVTPEMVEHADSIVAYRTYPHVDRAETGAFAAKALSLLLERGRPAGRALRKLPFLIPLNDQCTLVEPSRSVLPARPWPRAISSISPILRASALRPPLVRTGWCGGRRRGFDMKDMVERYDKLMANADECELIGNLATDKAKRETFKSLAASYREMASVLKVIIDGPAD